MLLLFILLFIFIHIIILKLFFSYFTAVSGTSMYQSWVYSVYNFALGLPIIFYGIFDRDISSGFALKHPEVNSFFFLSYHII